MFCGVLYIDFTGCQEETIPLPSAWMVQEMGIPKESLLGYDVGSDGTFEGFYGLARLML